MSFFHNSKILKKGPVNQIKLGAKFWPKKRHEVQILTQCACGQIWPKRRRKIQMLPNVTKSDQKHREIFI